MKQDDNINENRRNLLKGVGIAAVSSLLPEQGKAAETKPAWDVPFTGSIPDTPPAGYNILLITSDQEHFFDRYPFPVPGRERLMKTGVTFKNHQNTANVCTSSRSVMYTGLHMPQTRMFDNLGFPWMNYDLDPRLGTIGHMMQNLGYYSCYQGKWHLSRKLKEVPQNATNKPLDIGELPIAEYHRIMETYGFNDYQDIGDIIGSSKGGYFFDTVIAAHGISWLRNKGRPLADKNTPWFMAVNLVNPHDVMYIDTDNPGEKVQWKKALDDDNHSMRPTQPPHNKLYQESWPNCPLPNNRHQSLYEPGRPAGHRQYLEAQALMEGQFPDEDRRWRKLQDYYFNCIRDSDQHLAAILDELDNLSLTDKTIIVFTSDHGELGGAHQMHGKGSSVYKEQIHVPMIISHPAYPGNKQCASLSCHLDLVPTLVSLTGCDHSTREKVLAGRKGKDMSPLLKKPEDATLHQLREGALYCYGMILYSDADYIRKFRELSARHLPHNEFSQEIAKLHPNFHYRSAIRMINDGNYKFSRYFSLKEHNTPEDLNSLFAMNDVELFDLTADPDENINLAHTPEKYQKLLTEMNSKLNKLIAEELGRDDGSYIPPLDGDCWNLTADQFRQLFRD